MSEFQPKTVEFTDEQLGIESVVHHVPCGLTDKQYDRLKRFEHLLTQASTYEERLNAGETIHWGLVNARGKVYATHLVVDRNMVFRMRRLAFNMYADEFAEDSTLNELALDIAYTSRVTGEEVMDDKELSELWGRE